MPSYLFIGGPNHGKTQDVAQFQTVSGYHVPQIEKSNVHQFEAESIWLPQIKTVTYKRRAVQQNPFGIKIGYVMAVDSMSDEAVHRKLGEYLIDKWLDTETAKLQAQQYEKSLSEKTLAKWVQINQEAFQSGLNSTSKGIIDTLSKYVPQLYTYHLINCPACKGQEQCVASIVIHLNDKHHWKLEDIADFVDKLPYDLTVKENQ